MRVAGIITAKGANIHSLTVSQDPLQPGVAHIRLVAELELRLQGRVINEMNRLIQVFEAVDLTPPGPADGADRNCEASKNLKTPSLPLPA